MSHIYIYSPSGAVRDRAAFRRGVKRLQAMGHEVEIDPDALASFERFAGDDATRLAAIGRAAASVKFRFEWKATLLALVLVAFCALVFVKGLGLPMPLFGSWFGA